MMLTFSFAAFASFSLDVDGNSFTFPKISNFELFDTGATPTTEASAKGGFTSNRTHNNLAGCHSTTSLKNKDEKYFSPTDKGYK